MLTAYLLVSHGSRDPRPQIEMEKLAELVRTQLEVQETIREVIKGDRINEASLHAHSVTATSTVVASLRQPLVGTATLELAEAPLHEQIHEFASRIASGCKQVQLLPLFLLPGVHVQEDIPSEVALAQKSLGEAISINQRPYLGSHPDLGAILASQLANVKTEAKILLAHGTRRAAGNEPVEAMAKRLGAVAAYWSVTPTLEEQIVAFAAAGCQQVAILPYFLFCGGITDAIAQSVISLQSRFPQVELSLANPIGVSLPLAQLIVKLTQDKPNHRETQLPSRSIKTR